MATGCQTPRRGFRSTPPTAWHTATAPDQTTRQCFYPRPQPAEADRQILAAVRHRSLLVRGIFHDDVVARHRLVGFGDLVASVRLRDRERLLLHTRGVEINAV